MKATESPLGETISALHILPVQVSITSEIAGWVIIKAQALSLLVRALVVGVVRVLVCVGVGPALVMMLIKGPLYLGEKEAATYSSCSLLNSQAQGE